MLPATQDQLTVGAGTPSALHTTLSDVLYSLLNISSKMIGATKNAK